MNSNSEQLPTVYSLKFPKRVSRISRLHRKMRNIDSTRPAKTMTKFKSDLSISDCLNESYFSSMNKPQVQNNTSILSLLGDKSPSSEDQSEIESMPEYFMKSPSGSNHLFENSHLFDDTILSELIKKAIKPVKADETARERGLTKEPDNLYLNNIGQINQNINITNCNCVCRIF